jgi:hypothetical protein
MMHVANIDPIGLREVGRGTQRPADAAFAASTRSPETGASADWDSAWRRLEDYLRAHQVHHRLHQHAIILRVLGRASVRHQAEPGLDPVQLALEEATMEIDAWFQGIVPGSEGTAARRSHLGRVTFQLVDGASQWPTVFLKGGDPPAGFVDALRRVRWQGQPDLRITSMVPRARDRQRTVATMHWAWQRLGRLLFATLVGSALFCGLTILCR